MLFFNLLMCIQLILYIIFGAVLYMPTKLNLIKTGFLNLLFPSQESIKNNTSSTETYNQLANNSQGTPESVVTASLQVDSPVISCSATDCGICINETSSSGFIASPDFPELYGNNRRCIYIIRTNTSRKIRLTFTDFIVEEEFDWIDIFDSENATIASSITPGVSLTGYRVPNPNDFISSSNIMKIVFLSDFDNTQMTPGLVGRWKASFSMI